MPEGGPLDISACEREPVHIPGRVQPHGAVLVLRETDLTILQASANTDTLLNRPVEELVGRSLRDVLGDEVSERLRRAAPCKVIGAVPVRLQMVLAPEGGQSFDVSAHCSGDVLILELEPREASPGPVSAPDLHYLLKAGFHRLQHSDSLEAFCQAAAEVVRRLTGFDRVMVYRFDEDWNGEVIAEDRRSDWEPYLGLRYPASDIPRQARDLYLKNALRLIADVHGEAVPLVPALNPMTGAPLDMTYTTLRAVSPVHIEYLKNMGVGASMSIAILRKGTLWGLIACHHASARYVPYDVRAACEILGQAVSLLVPEKEAAGGHEYALSLKSKQAALVASISAMGDVLRGLADATPSILDYVEAEGAAVLLEGRCVLLGRTPPEEDVRRLASWLSQVATGEVYATRALARAYPEAGSWASGVACGLLAIPLSRASHSFILWFRPEVARTVNWGGDPHKRVEVVDGTERLSPRKSFALWQELVRGESAPWRSVEVEAARDLRQAVLGMLVSLGEVRRAEEQKRAAYERERMIAETLQSALLSDVPREGFPGLVVAAMYAAAWAEANVGGDFYDTVALPQGKRVALVVGDVVGKGLAAAQHIMEAKFALRAFLMENNGDTAGAMTQLNALVHALHDGDPSSLIALAVVVVDPETGAVEFASAGAEYPVLVGEGGAVRSLEQGNVVLGVAPDTRYESGRAVMRPDETLLLVTDGITEARRKNEFLEAEGAARLLSSVPGDAPLEQAARTVLEGARAFSGGTLRDDACVLVARLRPEGQG